jgi:predicted AAA+ superfamily ATPase
MIYLLLIILLIVIIISVIKSRKQIQANRKYWIRVFFGLVFGAILLRHGQALFALLAIVFPFLLRNFGSITYLASLFNRSKKNYQHDVDQDLTRAEAAEILGVSINASEAEINAKYKKLMKSVHPDKDGSEYMSKLINKAKDTLLK